MTPSHPSQRKVSVYASPQAGERIQDVRHILIEPTNYCNHRCVFCYNSKMQIPKGYMDMVMYRGIVEEAYDYGIREVGLYLRGEPFLHPDIVRMVSDAKHIGYEKIHIVTNGDVQFSRIHSAVRSGLTDIIFSINSGGMLNYHDIHGRWGFETAFEGVKAIAQLKRNYDLPLHIGVSFIEIDQNTQTYPILRDLVAPYVDEIICAQVGNQGGYSESNNLLHKNGCKAYASVPCGLPFHRPHVTWDGKVSACCVDFGNDLIMGDFTKQAFAEIWEGADYRSLRYQHCRKMLTGRCKKCIETQEKP